MSKLYEVSFKTIDGKIHKMRLWLSPEIAAMKLHPMKLVKEKK